MRLTEAEKQVLLAAVQRVDPEAEIWLFGSRADDRRRGGDIDLAILSEHICRKERHAIRHEICDQIGEQKIDIVVTADRNDPMFACAVKKGVPLHEKARVG
jgi:uncharacterized protein